MAVVNNTAMNIRVTCIFSFFKKFIYVWLCWVFVVTLGLSLVAVGRLLTAVASLVAGHRF